MMTMDDLLAAARKADSLRSTTLIYHLLGAWVSETEPVVIWQHRDGFGPRIIGLGMLDDPSGKIYLTVESVMARWRHACAEPA